MRLLIPFLCLAASSAPLAASIPTSTRHGPWHVTSISSLFGNASNNDPSASLTQNADNLSFEVRWSQESPVSISLEVSGCDEPENEPEYFYKVDAGTWLNASASRLTKQLGRDLASSTGQANLICGPAIVRSKLSTSKLASALRDFNDRVRSLSGQGK